MSSAKSLSPTTIWTLTALSLRQGQGLVGDGRARPAPVSADPVDQGDARRRGHRAAPHGDLFRGRPVRLAGWLAALLRRKKSGGGVLQDIGTHALDLLTWWLGPLTVVHYSDDAMGGIEANAWSASATTETDVRVRLSRDWARPNRYHFEGDRG